MKSVVKLAKSIHVDTQTLSTMFIGYFVLLIVVGTFIVNGMNNASEDASSVITSSEVRMEHNQVKH